MNYNHCFFVRGFEARYVINRDAKIGSDAEYRDSRRQIEPQRKTIAAGAIEFQHNTHLFYSFGICGNNEVVSREGPFPLKT